MPLSQRICNNKERACSYTDTFFFDCSQTRRGNTGEKTVVDTVYVLENRFTELLPQNFSDQIFYTELATHSLVLFKKKSQCTNLIDKIYFTFFFF